MRILIVHNKYKQQGGEDIVVLQELKAYKELGHEVELYEVTNAQLSLIDIFLSVFNVFSAFRLKKKIKTFNPELVHFHNIIFKLSPSVFWVIPKRIRVVMTIHNYRFLCPSGTMFYDGKVNFDSKTTIGLLKNIMRGVYQNSKTKTLFLTLIYKLNYLIGSFKRIDTFIFLTPFAKELHQKFGNTLFDKSIIKPNFLSFETSKDEKMKNIDLIFIGRFTEEKGIKDIIETLIEHAHFNIHLVGDGPIFNEISMLCKEHDHIKLHGLKSREEILELLKKSKYLLFPSIWYEGMPMTILEAYACGVPVIGKKIGTMKDMIKNKITGFHYVDNEQFEDILNNLNTYNYEELKKNSYKEYLNNYSQEIGLKKLKKMLSE